MKLTSIEIHSRPGLVLDTSPPPPPPLEPAFLRDHSGNGFDLIPFYGLEHPELFPTITDPILVGSAGAVNASPEAGAIGSYFAPEPMGVLGGSWWAFGWVPDVSAGGTIFQLNLNGVYGPAAAFAYGEDDPGVSHSLNAGRYNGTDIDFGINVSVPNSPGKSFILLNYVADVDEYRFYENGVNVGTVNGQGNPGGDSDWLVLGGSGFNETMEDAGFGVGELDPGDILDAYNAGLLSASFFRSTMMGLNPYVFYWLDAIELDPPDIPPVEPDIPDGLIVLSFKDPQTLNPYNAKTILGLDADELIPLYSGVTEVTKLYNLALKKRNVVMQIGLNPDYANDETYSKLRDALYRVIAASRTGLVQLQFKHENVVVAEISGFVSKLESELFQKDQEVQMTLSCKNSMLKSMEPVGFPFSSSDPSTTVLQDDKSNAPHGFWFVLEFTGSVATLTISNTELGYVFTVRPPGGFIDGDHLYFSSDFGNKYLVLLRGEDRLHLVDCVDPNSIWPILFPGTNEFEVSSGPSSFFNLIQHYETYWGV